MKITKFNQDAMLELYETAADKISEKMRRVRNNIASYERSWIWELIQNAKDNVASDFYSQKVSIKIDISSSNFQFSHNYGYFTSKNVEGIIRQVNKKDVKNSDEITNKPVIIGRFGTGFMTTHLLSKKIDVKALYFDDNVFKKFVEFPIDRTNIDKDFLVRSIDNSFTNAEKSIDNAISHSKEEINFSDYNSIFSYQLDEDAKDILRTGITDLFHSLPYTLVFVDGIKKVEIDNMGVRTLFVKVEKEPLSQNIKLVHIVKDTENQTEDLIFAYLNTPIRRKYKQENIEVDVKIIIPLVDNNGTYSIDSIQKDIPYIFIDFPLIGTENFHFPVIINFPLFEPTEPRDGIYLGEQEEGLANREVFEVSLDLIIQLIDFAVVSKWGNLYNLAKASLPKIEHPPSKDWFKTNIQNPIRSHLLKSEIVQTETNRILLENALFPYATESKKIEEVWHLAKILHGDKLPKFSHIHEWHKIIDSTWNKDLRYDLEKLVKEIADYGNLSKLMQRVALDKQETLTWLNSVIEFVISSENEKLLSEYTILPNQNGDFRKKSEVFCDDGIAEPLKDILDNFVNKFRGEITPNWRFKDILLDKNIKGFEEYQSKSTRDISIHINDLMRKLINNNMVEIFGNLLFDLVSFSSEAQQEDRKRLLNFSHAIFNKNIKSELEILPNLDNFDFKLANEKTLELLAKKLQELHIIANLKEFNNIFNTKNESQTIEWLDDFISFVASFENESYKKLLNNFAFIPNQNNGFCNLKSLKRDDNIPNDLKEIANATHINQDWNDWLLHKGLKNVSENLFDENTTQSLKNIADEIDSYVRDYDGDKQKASFSELVFLLNKSETVNKDKENKFFPYFLNNRNMLLVGTLGEGQDLENVATMLKHREKLGIFTKLAESDITTGQLEVLSNMESDKLSAIVEIANSGISLPELKQVVNLVGADKIKAFITEVEEEQERTRLGEIAESIFKTVFKNEGFTVEKTGRGSDFQIKKGGFDCLVEIKSFVESGMSRKEVRMTSYQAKTAISSENYVLCVFPKTSTSPTEDDFKKKVKFVTNISENLKDRVINAGELEQQRKDLENQDIGLAFEKWEYKYTVSECVWETGKDLESFIKWSSEYIKNQSINTM
ncbi:sacsin N-terminal ATP-binding-like domain-containing protein [Acinetobacter modestus]|uniref:sacsin N-terminal ATP-binding-like domain-containing protein n=1 Tax=Acinetobacter modestus TaxID=1776740 RepID=UPI003015973E